MAVAIKEKNLKGKMVKRQNAYEVYATTDLSWVWYVLKHWQAPSAEATNPYARVLCEVFSPMTAPSSDLGDVYVREIEAQAFDARFMLASAEATVANATIPQSIRDRAAVKVERLKAILAGNY